jgi:hypothetical protein
VTNFLLFLVGVFGVALYFMTTDERTRVFRTIRAALHNARDTVVLQGVKGDPFFDALRARTARVIAMPALIVLSTAVFVRSPILDLLVSAICLWQIGLILERIVGLWHSPPSTSRLESPRASSTFPRRRTVSP